MDTHLDHIRIEGSTKHGRHQPDVFSIQVSLERTKQYYTTYISTSIRRTNKPLPALLSLSYVCYLPASRLQNTIRAFRACAFYNPGPQSLFDEADVGQQLSKLPLETGNLLRMSQEIFLFK